MVPMLTRLLDDGILTCPTCRAPTETGLRNAPLAMERVYRDDDLGQPLQAHLQCSACGTRYPVIDGIACVFIDTAAWLRREERAVLGRDDLDPALAGWLCEAWSETEDPNWRRQLLAVYGRAFPGDTPRGAADVAVESLVASSGARLAAAEARLVEALPAGGLVLDAGCGVGRGTVSGAAQGLRMVGFDSDFTALRMLARLLRTGATDIPVWESGGMDFSSRRVVVDDALLREQVALVAGDVLAPPFAGRRFDGVASMNLIDNVSEPVVALRQLHGLTRPGGRLLLATPFAWSERVTPRAQRLGDGIRDASGAADPVLALHALLQGRLPDHAPEVDWDIVQSEDLPWVLVRHDRSAHVYITHLVEAERRAP